MNFEAREEPQRKRREGREGKGKRDLTGLESLAKKISCRLKEEGRRSRTNPHPCRRQRRRSRSRQRGEEPWLREKDKGRREGRRELKLNKIRRVFLL